MIRACALAVERTGVEAPRAVDALAVARHGGPSVDTVRTELIGLVHELDDAAWDLQDKVEAVQAEHATYLRAFAKARAVAAIAFALDQAEGSELDSLYEAYHAIGDNQAFALLMEEALRP